MPDLVRLLERLSQPLNPKYAGTTTETVSANAPIKPPSSGTIDDAKTWVDDNIYAEDFVNPPFEVDTSAIVRREVSKNQLSKSYGTTIEYLDGGDPDFKEDYTVEVSRDLNLITVNISGTIRGLGEESTVTTAERFNNAKTAYNTTKAALFA